MNQKKIKQTRKKHLIFLCFFVFLINFAFSNGYNSHYKYWFEFYYATENGKIEKSFDILEEFSSNNFTYNKKKEIYDLIWTYSLSKLKNNNPQTGKKILYELNKYQKEDWALLDDIAITEIKDYSFFSFIKYSFLSFKSLFKRNLKIIPATSFTKAFFYSLFLSFFIFILFNYIDRYKAMSADLKIRKKFSILIFIFIFLLSGILYLGIFYLPFILLAFVIFYLSREEKKIIWIFFAFFIIFLVLNTYNNLVNKVSDNPIYNKIVKIRSGYYNDNDLNRAVKMYSDSKDQQLGITVAWRYFMDQNYFKSRNILEEIPDGSKYDEVKYYLLGNVNYKIGFFEKAKVLYKKALEIEPKAPYVNHNLGVLLLTINQSSFAQKYLDISRKAGIKERSDIILDCNIPKINKFKYIDLHFEANLLFHPILLGILVFLIIIIILKIFLPSIGKSINCSICGKPTKKFRGNTKKDHCEECISLFIAKDPLLRETRKIRYSEIEAQNEKKSKFYLILSLFVPGIKFVQSKLYLLYLIFSFIIYFLIFSSFFLNKYLSQLKDGNFMGNIFLLILSAFVVYLISNILLFFIERQEWR